MGLPKEIDGLVMEYADPDEESPGPPAQFRLVNGDTGPILQWLREEGGEKPVAVAFDWFGDQMRLLVWDNGEWNNTPYTLYFDRTGRIKDIDTDAQ